MRTALIAAAILALPNLAQAGEVCAKIRPDWSGGPVSALDEALFLFGTPAALVLMIATGFAIRFRSAWGGLACFVGWSFLVSAFTLFDPTGGQRALAAAEGCIGQPTLFIALVGALSIGTIIYTGRPLGKPDNDEL